MWHQTLAYISRGCDASLLPTSVMGVTSFLAYFGRAGTSIPAYRPLAVLRHRGGRHAFVNVFLSTSLPNSICSKLKAKQSQTAPMGASCISVLILFGNGCKGLLSCDGIEVAPRLWHIFLHRLAVLWRFALHLFFCVICLKFWGSHFLIPNKQFLFPG